MAASILSDMRGETNNINRAIRVIAGLLILLSLALGVSASSLYYFKLLVVVDRFCRGQPVPERPDHMVSDGKILKKAGAEPQIAPSRSKRGRGKRSKC